MSVLTRRLTAVAATAVAIGAGAVPAFATTSSTNAITTQTPLVAAITTQTPKIHLGYTLNGGRYAQEAARGGYYKSSQAATAVNRVRADAAQYPAKLEWIVGVDMQASGDATTLAWGKIFADYTPAARSQAVDEYRLSNFYIGQADSQLRISHPARTARPFDPNRKGYTPAGPGTLHAPVGLDATIIMATPVLQEQKLPDNNVEESIAIRAFVATNAAAARYYAFTVARMRVDAAQRRGQQEWVAGLQTQLRGDDRYAYAKHGHLDDATINRNLQIAFGDLRRASTELAHADALLGIHPHGPSLLLPHPLPY